MTLPATSLFRVLARRLDASVIDAVVAPTIADLQDEVQTAPSPWRRRLAIARGFLALGRVFLVHGLLWRLVMRRFVTVVMLGGVGAALLVKAFSVTTSGPAQISPFFLMMALTPLVIRYVSNRPGRREMFLTCMGVGTLMSVALLGWFAFMKNTAHASLSSYAISSVLLLSCVALASWVIAVIASDRPDTDGRGQRRMLLDILASASLFGVCYSLLGVWRHFSGAAGVFNTVSWAVFLASFFGLVAVAIYLPILSLTRGLVRNPRVAVIAIGALLFPVPLLAFPLLQGRLELMVRALRGDPLAFLPMALPYIIAGATLGWLITAPRVESQRS